MKIHLTKKHKSKTVQEFKGLLADKAVQISKLMDQQKQCRTIHCKGKRLDNVFKLKYIGTLFASNGDRDHDVDRRLSLAETMCGKLGHIFDSQRPSMHICQYDSKDHTYLDPRGNYEHWEFYQSRAFRVKPFCIVLVISM